MNDEQRILIDNAVTHAKNEHHTVCDEIRIKQILAEKYQHDIYTIEKLRDDLIAKE